MRGVMQRTLCSVLLCVAALPQVGALLARPSRADSLVPAKRSTLAANRSNVAADSFRSGNVSSASASWPANHSGPIGADRPLEDFPNLPEVWDESNYSKRAAVMHEKCLSYPACIGLCEWIRDSLQEKHSNITESMKAADVNGDGKVDALEFLEQCKAAGVADEALSARSYFILYLIDINADGFVSEASYERVFDVAKHGLEAENANEIPAHDELADELNGEMKRVYEAVKEAGDDYLRQEADDPIELSTTKPQHEKPTGTPYEPPAHDEHPRPAPRSATTTVATEKSAACSRSVAGVVIGATLALLGGL